jgi:SAM-dependent methyltransferase
LPNVVTKTREGGESPLISKILSLNGKIKRGDYMFEEVPCFCGSNEGMPVTNKDRYGIFYTLRLCPKCGIMYASPRMAAKSAEEFYQSEYRGIYEYGFSKDDEWQLGINRARGLAKLLEDFEIEPKVIFDIGCNMGQHLYLFKDKAETYGVDYSEENILHGREKGLNLFYGGIGKLEVLDRKADFIILSHVLEHFSDIEKELDRIKDLLTPDGYLYIEVPGLYTHDLKTLFQNAHNWQFNDFTLIYLMKACGWEELYVDSQIKSIWKYTGIKDKDIRPVQNQCKEIYDFLFSGNNILPKLNVNCMFPLKQRKKNIEKAISFQIKDISILHEKHKGKEAIIIGGGPSISNYINKIKELKASGNIIVSIERMYQWCLDNNIVPDYVLVLDASNDVLQSFDRIHPDTTHVIATQCNEDIFERLKDKNSVIFSSAQAGINFANSYDKHDYNKITIINTGSSVTLAAMSISMFLGLKNMHIFGFDCHVSGGNYAKGITGIGAVKDIITVEIDGRDFQTTIGFISFVQQFFEILKLGEANKLIGKVKIYGDSMVKAASKIDIDGDKDVS